MNLDDWRSRINDLDNQLLNLLNQRAEAALRIGDLKRRKDLAYFVPEREAEIVDRLVKDNGGALPPRAGRAVLRGDPSAAPPPPPAPPPGPPRAPAALPPPGGPP